MPRPSSRATMISPLLPLSCAGVTMISPRVAYRTMFRASSEMAVATMVASPEVKPSRVASRRPCWRTVTMSASDRMDTRTSSVTSTPSLLGRGRPAVQGLGGGPRGPLPNNLGAVVEPGQSGRCRKARMEKPWWWRRRRSLTESVPGAAHDDVRARSEEHTSELQSHHDLVCRLLLERYGDHRYLHSFPTRRSSDLGWRSPGGGVGEGC